MDSNLTKQTERISCQHKNGVMIPQRDLEGNYVKPTHMICNECRLVLEKEIA